MAPSTSPGGAPTGALAEVSGNGGRSAPGEGPTAGRVRRWIAAVLGQDEFPNGEDPTQLLSFLVAAGSALLVLAAFGLLAVRSVVRLDPSFDTFFYHLPFAAVRAGIPTSFDLPPHVWALFDGFPPLADLLQGLLWRVTGLVTAAQWINYLALVGFLIWCQRLLRAPFWIVGLGVLTTPLVIIHASVAYIDLFTNVLVAIGASTCLYLWLHPDRLSRAHAIGAALALAAAAWSKYTVVPVVGVLYVALFFVLLRASRRAIPARAGAVIGIIVVGALIAAIPYARNLVVFGNPFWPLRVPLIGGLFPYLTDSVAVASATNPVPANLRDAPQFVVFLRSLLEVGLPTHYSHRPRWILDQYSSDPNLARMGGFWNVAVVFSLAVFNAGLIAIWRWRGVVAAAGAVVVLGVVAVLPQSQELRYFMFIPLTWAAGLGMIVPQVSKAWPRIGLALLVVAAGLMVVMAITNRTYYRPKPAGWADVAKARGAAIWWSTLEQGHSYCVINMPGLAFLMTGPTMNDFEIHSRLTVADCPPGSEVLTSPPKAAP